VPLQATMQRRPRQVGNAGLQGIEAVIKRQQSVLPERHDDRFFRDAQHRGMGILGARPDIGCAAPPPPLGNRLGVDPMPFGENPQALLTILYCSTASLLDDAPHHLRASPAVVLALP
jgi:hypothetical protein